MRIKSCTKRVPTPKKSLRRRWIVVEDDYDTEIVGHVQVVKESQERGEAQPREEAHEDNNQAEVEVQNEDSVRLPQHLGDPPHSSSLYARQISQPPLIPVLSDEPPSTQSQSSQPPIEHDQQLIHTDGLNPVPPSEDNVSKPIAPEQQTQYIPHPYKNPLLQSIPDSVEGWPKINKRRSIKRPPPTRQSFILNPDPDKPPTFYVPVDKEDFSDGNAGYHCYDIASDEDTDDTSIFPQSNADAPVSQVRLELGMEFETLNQFRKEVQKFNINIERSIFFDHCDSTRSKTICYDEDCPWQIYCAKRTFRASYQVKTFVNEHTCSRDNHCKSANGKWYALFYLCLPLKKNTNCQLWQLTGLPCRHACAASAYHNRRPEEYAHNWLIMDAYNVACQTSIVQFQARSSGSTLTPSPFCHHGTENQLEDLQPRETREMMALKRRAGHNKRSCKKRNEAIGEGNSASQVPVNDEDEDMLAEMYWEETLEAAEAEQEATEEGNRTATPHAAQQPQPMPPPPNTQPQPPTNNATTKKQVKRRSIRRPPPTRQILQPSTPSVNLPTTTPSTHNSQTTPHPLQGASAETSTRFIQFMTIPSVVTPIARGRGTTVRGRGQSRGRGRIGASSGGKNGISSGSSNSTPIL
ncbi:hypothetical protein Ahy_B10g105198 isoform A [Arachis hypogaea]|uniref:Zinc finger PMZ-type domain-containing protein n=1 Tax=Arachis hypogaea TaxID=3818 RepID=A0A444X7F2_ARAHY|nr:hypothetical protein Ahy_B10g105198 isoform A [Arachis hypogaea]